jgi:hypothetical protein
MKLFLQLVQCLPLAVLLAWMPPVRSADGTDGPTFAEFRAACAKLPKNRVLGGRLPPEELLPLPKFDVVGAELDRFFAAVTNGPAGSPASWVAERPQAGFTDVTRSWFAGGKTPFEPFVRKLVLPPGSRLLLQGDLHGDIHSLLAVLGRLQERGLMDGFRITDPAFQIAFLGDYTDRGVYGVEVIYTLLRLHRANPGRVHLVRGNHEDISLVSRYGFLAEGRGKYGRDFDATKILRAYDFLPVALYLGQGGDFVQMCHGGMEPGYDPAALLASEGTNRFQLIGELRQVQYLRGNPDWLAKEPMAADEAQGLFRDFRPEAPTSPTVLGFMWNDFTVFGAEPAFANNPERAYIYGRPAVQQLLRQAGGATARVHAVLRAHQHSGGPNPLMRRLVASRGIFRHWQETEVPTTDTVPLDRLETTAVRGIPEGSVWTLNVVPDSVYGQGNGFTFATVILLDIGDTFASWRLNVDTVEVPVR